MQNMAVKKIIIPTDFSESARNAVHYAVELFGLEGVEYTLLNCYAMPHTGTEMLISLTDILRLESDEGLGKFKAELEKAIPGLDRVVKTRCENGYLETVLNKISRKEDPYLIVMGTKGARGVTKMLWGSNTATVLKRVKTPILAVPFDAEVRKPERITMALQQEMISHFPYPPLLLHLLEKHQAKFTIVSVDDQPLAAPAVAVKAAGSDVQTFISDHTNVHNTDAVQGIRDYLETQPSDILVMVAREYGLLKKVFHQSSTQAMAMLSSIPLLVLREE